MRAAVSKAIDLHLEGVAGVAKAKWSQVRVRLPFAPVALLHRALVNPPVWHPHLQARDQVVQEAQHVKEIQQELLALVELPDTHGELLPCRRLQLPPSLNRWFGSSPREPIGGRPRRVGTTPAFGPGALQTQAAVRLQCRH
jgi:hypothetical protein